MRRTQTFKQFALAVALGSAFAASAQTMSPAPGSSGAIPSADQSPTGTTGVSPNPIAPSARARVPANRDKDAIRACANVAASDMESCIARENARKGTRTGVKGAAPVGSGNMSTGAGGTSTDLGNGMVSPGNNINRTPASSGTVPSANMPAMPSVPAATGAPVGGYNSGGTGTTGGSAIGTGTSGK